MNTWNINLDVSKSTAYNAPVIISQGDKAGTTILATIFDHGTQCTLTGMTAKFMLRSSGGYFEDASCTVSGSTITYVVDEEHAATVAGMAQAYFAIYQGSTHVYSTSRFDVKVLRAASSGADPAQSYSDDIVAATQAARAAADAAEEAMEDIGTAASDAQQAAASASQAVSDAQQAVSDADTAKQTATSAANAATSAAASANAAASSANAAAAATNTAIETANDAAARAEDAIDAIGDISEIAVPLMSADVRGGAKLGEGLALTDGALGIDPAPHESTGEVRGSIAALTAKGHAEQASTTGKNLLPRELASQNGHSYNGIIYQLLNDGSISVSGTSTNVSTGPRISVHLLKGTYTLSKGTTLLEISTGIQINGGSTICDGASLTFTVDEDSDYTFGCRVGSGITIDEVWYPQLELGSEATDYEPYTNGPSPSPDWPQEIQVVRGRNLLDVAHATVINAYTADNGTVTASTNSRALIVAVKPSTTYALQGRNVFLPNPASSTDDWRVGEYVNVPSVGSTGTLVFSSAENAIAHSFTTSPTTNYLLIKYGTVNTVDNNATFATIQLELGSYATPYVPYGHVGMEARDPDTDELISCTALPLPSRGWVASLPDGTADVLALDGAGKVTWKLPVGHESYSGTDIVNISGSRYGVPIKSARVYLGWAMQKLCTIAPAIQVASNNTHVYFDDKLGEQLSTFTGDFDLYYPLATPVTEHAGYVDMPSIPSEATVSIPELDALGVRYLIGDSVREMAEQWYERGLAEHGGETLGHVAPVEGETATANHAAGTYLVHGGQLCKVTSAIATGEEISIGTNVTTTTVMAEVLALTQ